MADFDLIQTDAQVQSILNDGQNMQGAGAQTTLTTESVLLKDVNGNYHKILKSSFTEAIRDTLAGLLVNNDKGTTINQIAAIANGDFGSITPANLASVLGVNLTHAQLTDANTNNNLFMCSGYNVGTTQNIPQEVTTWGYFMQIPGNSYDVVQYLIPFGTNNIYMRYRDGVSTYSNWKRITNSYLNQYSDLSSLASALGGCVSNSYPTDLNTLTTPGIYGVTDSEVQNMPATGYGICIVIGSPALGALSQIQLCGLSEKLYYRRIGSTDYSLAEWKLL